MVKYYPKIFTQKILGTKLRQKRPSRMDERGRFDLIHVAGGSRCARQVGRTVMEGGRGEGQRSAAPRPVERRGASRGRLQEVSFPRVKCFATPLLHTSPPRPLSSLSHSSLLGLTRFASPHEKTTNPGSERKGKSGSRECPPSPSFCSNRGAAPREIRPACPAASAAAEVSAALSTDPLRGAAPPLSARFGTRVWPGVPLPHSLTAAASAGSCGWTRSSGGSPVANWRSPVRGSGSGLGD